VIASLDRACCHEVTPTSRVWCVKGIIDLFVHGGVLVTTGSVSREWGGCSTQGIASLSCLSDGRYVLFRTLSISGLMFDPWGYHVSVFPGHFIASTKGSHSCFHHSGKPTCSRQPPHSVSLFFTIISIGVSHFLELLALCFPFFTFYVFSSLFH